MYSPPDFPTAEPDPEPDPATIYAIHRTTLLFSLLLVVYLLWNNGFYGKF